MNSSTVSSDSVNVASTTATSKIDVTLVKWEEFALCLEEHFHALEMFKRKPNGKPMGHR